MAIKSGKISILTGLTLLAIIVLPFGVLASSSPIAGLRIYLLDIIIGLIFLCSIPQIIKKRKELVNNSVIKAFGIFSIFALFSLLINSFHLNSQEFLISFSYWIRLIAYGSVLCLPLFLNEQIVQKLPLKLYIAGVVFVVLGYIQYFFYPNLRNLMYLGWDEHLYRFFGTFLDPNFAAPFLILTFLLGLGLLIQTKRKSKKMYWLFTSLILIVPAIFLTYSRSGFIMFSVSIITFLILIKQIKWVIVSILILGIGVIFIPKNLGGEGVNLFRTASINARVESFDRGVEIFQQSPIYGVGFNAYRYAQIDAGFKIKNEESNHAGAGVSNSWLFVLATTGVIGFLLYLYFWFEVLRNLFKNKKSVLASVLIAGLMGLFIEAFFENSLFYIFIMFWVFLMIGFVNFKSKQT